MSAYQRSKDQSLALVKSFEQQATSAMRKAPGDPGSFAGGGGSNAGAAIFASSANRRQREAYSLMRNWVYVAVNAVAKRLAGQPFEAGELINAPENPDRAAMWMRKRKRAMTTGVPNSILERAHLNQDLEMLPTHPVLDTLARPNGVQKKFEFLYISTASLLITGVSYWIGGVRTGANGEDEIELWAVPSSWLTPIHDGGLFTGYMLQASDGAEPTPIPTENVARTYFPDPSDIKSVLSPLQAILASVRIDDRLQSSQENMFERGINPNLLVTVGRVRGADGKLTDRRPRLGGHQRKQIIRAIRELWGNTVSAGDPAIIDGMIESVHKLQMTPQEMDWMDSGEIVKRRIFQAFAVNPISVGEIVGSNRAQSVEADKHLCMNAVNPIGNALSETATDFLGPMYETPQRLFVWIQPCEPSDPDLELKRWSEARKLGDVTRDEYRAEQLGLPPSEDKQSRNTLLTTVGGMNGTVQILAALGAGQISEEQAKRTLMLFLEIDEATATAMVERGDAGEVKPPALPAPEPADGDGEPPASDDDDSVDEDAPDAPDAPNRRSVKKKAASIGLKRSDVEKLHTKRSDKRTEQLAKSLARSFRASIREFTEQLAESNIIVREGEGKQQADEILDEFFDVEVEAERVRQAALEVLPSVFIEGALTEIELEKAVRWGRKTTAEEIAERLNIDVPGDIAINQLPEWLFMAATDELSATMREPYWQEIPETTRDDIYLSLADGMNEGWSIRRIAADINRQHGSEYSLMRATRVARTEIPNMMNAGHSAGIENLQAETGLQVGKEWVSVLGSTTRDTHARLDGQQTRTAEGTFRLGGVDVPWPAHRSLPAGERINCQCTVISAFVMDQLDDEPKPEPDAPAQPKEEHPSGIPPLKSMKQIGKLGGSTGAELYVDDDGNKYVVKAGSSPDHLKEEFATEELYRVMGVKVPDSRMDFDAEPPRKISRHIDNTKTLGEVKSGRFKINQKIHKDFAADAVLGNWDVAGLGKDNILITADGTPIRIDAGGALRFRAKGERKGDLFTDEVLELWTLRDRRMNSDAADIFSTMTTKEIETSARRALKHKKKVIDKLKQLESDIGLAPEVRRKMEKRFKSLKQFETTAKTLRKDKWSGGYIDQFAKHEAQMEHAGVFDSLPKQLTSDGSENLVDEKGNLFDHLRGSTQTPQAKFARYLRENGGRHEIIQDYYSGQANSSWSNEAVIHKVHLLNARTASPDQYYWPEAGASRFLPAGGPKSRGEAFELLDEMLERKGIDVDQYEQSMIANHAFNYNFLKRVKVPHSDRRRQVLSVARTEERFVVEDIHKMKSGDSSKIKRGAAESYSLTNVVVVSGNATTYQELPFHRVFGFYAHERRPGRGGTLLYDDEENAVIAMSEGIEATYTGKASYGEPVLAPSEWKKRRKKSA